MARPQKLIPSYRKHKPSGQAVVTIAGRTFYLGPHGTKASELEYDRLIAERLASGRSASYGAPADALTVTELLAAYMRHAKAAIAHDFRTAAGAGIMVPEGWTISRSGSVPRTATSLSETRCGW